MSSIIKVTSVIIGTIIGAGFISGQEIYSFFNKYGATGQIGIIIAISLISIIIYKTLKIINEHKIESYEEFLEKTIKSKSQIITYTIKNIINIFLVISFLIMCSAFSTYCYENYQIPLIIGGTIISILSYIILKKDVKTIIKLNTLLMPILIIFILIIGIRVANWNNVSFSSASVLPTIIKGILYANYNCIVLIPMLITLKKEIKNKFQIKKIAIISFIIMYLLTEIIYTSQNKIEITQSEMPMLEISKQISKSCITIYGLITGIAIFTSAISAGHSLMNNTKNSLKIKQILTIILCAIAIPISTISFASLVNLAYPVFGVLGIIQIFFILKT